jgi:hypothetical protein
LDRLSGTCHTGLQLFSAVVSYMTEGAI